MTLLSLTSRVVRRTVAANGIRIISIDSTTRDGQYKILGQISIALIKDIWEKTLSFLSKFSLSQLWSGVVATTQFVLNFNWNTTDEEINQSIKGNINTIAGLLGQGAGRIAGTVACGAVPLAGLYVLNPTIAKAVTVEVSEGLIDLVADEMVAIIKNVARLTAQSTFLWTYGNIKRLIRGSDEDFKKKLKKAGFSVADVEKQLADRNKPFVISQKIQSKIDDIKNETVRNFVDEFYQELGPACTEAGYVFAGAIDTHLAQKDLIASEALIEISYDSQGKPKVREIK